MFADVFSYQCVFLMLLCKILRHIRKGSITVPRDNRRKTIDNRKSAALNRKAIEKMQVFYMVNQLSYRTGSEDDLKQLQKLGIASYGQYAKVLTPENFAILDAFLHNEQAWRDLFEKATSFVSVDHDVIVGMAYLISSGNPTDIYQEDWCYIRMVGVHPHYTGRGIAKTLTKVCIDKAKEWNEKTIALHTSEFMDAARHIYESLGFKVLKEIPPRFGKRYWVYTLDIS